MTAGSESAKSVRFALIMTVLLGTSVFYAQEHRSELRIEALTVLGEPVRAEVQLLDLSQVPFPYRRYDTISDSILLAPSTYLMRIKAPGFATRHYIGNVVGQETKLRIGVNVARVTDEIERSIAGRVLANAGERAGVWLKLVSVLENDDVRQSSLSATGDYVFRGLAGGEYVLLSFRGQKLIGTRQITCGGVVRVDLQV